MWTKEPPTEDGAYFVIVKDHTGVMVGLLMVARWVGYESRTWSVAGLELLQRDEHIDWFWSEPITGPAPPTTRNPPEPEPPAPTDPQAGR